ncbi:MAG: ribosomal L7Ae/L30e/S12e/Gadd45 family protein [Paeniclostridium sordellii]|uniref:Ribosomal L7Ae/L30e/S12e/Gadd45 family protein n=1 Tax=Paeniclostridium hominis TaxID=2764329 RepID=A0ABR7JZZ7_9FIRM|nr:MULTISPECIES: ribosomal L7Ae/L30e/S12e/Gadd45 family protein [Paeniclostridium]MBC6002438.1 ribosomal L7Ae/L30e/S12e/Gadd45 family protein [Paeniclostridium hominis]MBC8632193.1 ribosomal L7Ae/L30e/S12e/Gadd45 family protein [[Eubacterium] tenue]MDU1539619.1 ribosomal L7Ae/L30e/S12e/Gadd45 family protein [Paeniclostridium sordellii]MDU2591662.1 ribosomal L7Ae/L30e/S12e/Gadd45 family protein [Paeniclostridium sordellii]
MNKANEAKIYSFLGLAQRAGKLVSGDDSTMLDIKKNRVKLVIVAEDASNNTKKLFKDKTSFRNIACVTYSTKLQLGLAIGKAPRAVMGIKDVSFADKVLELIENTKI